jgi:hypothetical protein
MGYSQLLQFTAEIHTMDSSSTEHAHKEGGGGSGCCLVGLSWLTDHSAPVTRGGLRYSINRAQKDITKGGQVLGMSKIA